MRCILCALSCDGDLCEDHKKDYLFDKEINGFRYKKCGRGTRYRKGKYSVNETKLAKIVEKIYGKSNVINSYRPLWALSLKHVLYEFDIYVNSKKILIEYNGQQHYDYNKFFHKDEFDFQYQQLKDFHKLYLSHINNFNLVIFKYDEPITLDYVKYKIEKEIQ